MHDIHRRGLGRRGLGTRGWCRSRGRRRCLCRRGLSERHRQRLFRVAAGLTSAAFASPQIALLILAKIPIGYSPI